MLKDHNLNLVATVDKMKHWSVVTCTGRTRLRLIWRGSILGPRRVCWWHLAHIVAWLETKVEKGLLLLLGGVGGWFLAQSEHKRRVFCFVVVRMKKVKRVKRKIRLKELGKYDLKILVTRLRVFYLL
ncbi:hypothetical protein VNO78_12185 [Psophocarpus tetragonolobus]|uniref:Uncharacterized protein n=1 Tax=Psophocarpus tetragonolobus TaxID=3891 RepID=A0AAN9SNH7_PSOTE